MRNHKFFFILSVFVTTFISFSCGKEIIYNEIEENSPIDSVYNPVDSVFNKDENDGTKKSITFSVLGNSISTYKGYIPSSFKCYSMYTPGKFKVEDTWWMLLKMISGYELLSNASWSGSTVVNEGASDSNSYFTSDKRLTELGRKGTPDIILVLGGTNDWGNNKELGDFPSDSLFDMKTFRGAYSYLVKKLCDMYPDSKICCCSILPRKGFDSPNKKGWYTTDGNKSIETITYKYGCIYLDLDQCGIQADFNKYTFDGLHPNALGMEKVANEIYVKIKQLGL